MSCTCQGLPKGYDIYHIRLIINYLYIYIPNYEPDTLVDLLHQSIFELLKTDTTPLIAGLGQSDRSPVFFILRIKKVA